jgi:hypothetical protein
MRWVSVPRTLAFQTILLGSFGSVILGMAGDRSVSSRQLDHLSGINLRQESNAGGTMRKSFVFIFRQGARVLSKEEQERRTVEVQAWATQQIKDGRNLDPRILGDEIYRAEDDNASPKTAGSVIALNFIEATDFAEAQKIARAHPGLRYGVSIEVRSWTDPRKKSAAE